jgi:hypothetical protein
MRHQCLKQQFCCNIDLDSYLAEKQSPDLVNLVVVQAFMVRKG